MLRALQLDLALSKECDVDAVFQFGMTKIFTLSAFGKWSRRYRNAWWIYAVGCVWEGVQLKLVLPVDCRCWPESYRVLQPDLLSVLLLLTAFAGIMKYRQTCPGCCC